MLSNLRIFKVLNWRYHTHRVMTKKIKSLKGNKFQNKSKNIFNLDKKTFRKINEKKQMRKTSVIEIVKK